MVNIELLKMQKKQLKLSFDELAIRTGYSRRAIIILFQNETPYPRVDLLQSLSNALQIPYDVLTGSNDNFITLSNSEQDLLKKYRALDPRHQEVIRMQIETLLEVDTEKN